MTAALATLAVTFASTPMANADPGGPACLTPSGAACAPPEAGCVNPDNGLPCSSSLADVNAAIRKELNSVLGGGLLGGG
ncbi:hypothetical protein [Mycobacterium sp. 3519A]|uniref:hypothetical protein n=1 Tax=Mycobacterium sp. 3519A TaxID=2057184 RepID=UPI000C7B7C95|nr:hypothetical protein [Mycobacterium sp. 3519A]